MPNMRKDLGRCWNFETVQRGVVYQTDLVVKGAACGNNGSIGQNEAGCATDTIGANKAEQLLVAGPNDQGEMNMVRARDLGTWLASQARSLS